LAIGALATLRTAKSCFTLTANWVKPIATQTGFCEPQNNMKEHTRDWENWEDEDDDTPTECETCSGTGEVGPFGWEYPEYEDCPDCKGSGLESDHPDPDAKFERMRDESL
jgi:hypothetical protein